MQDASHVVGQVQGRGHVRRVLDEVVGFLRLDILGHDLDVIIPVNPGLLVQESDRVKHLVHDDADLHTPLAWKDHSF